MKIIETPLPGLLILEPCVYEDNRGYFFESYHLQKYSQNGIEARFVQDNESKSGRGVVRGFHYQLNPVPQAKLVRVVVGEVYDVALDLRKGSPTFGQWFGLEINETNKKQLFIPRGFAHGFSVLSETAVFSYKCDNNYSRENERTINPFDPQLGIDWQLDITEYKVSHKDQVAPLFADAEINFIF
jgi:dTDP-4-dehydrorhamnose 3,5-epimerase